MGNIRIFMTFDLDHDPPTLDINLGDDDVSRLVLGQLVEGLYRYRPDGSLEPAGATGYAASQDATVYTVTLRSDAVWSDGQPVTAQHYEDGIIRLLDPNTGAGSAWRQAVFGASDCVNASAARRRLSLTM